MGDIHIHLDTFDENDYPDEDHDWSVWHPQEQPDGETIEERICLGCGAMQYRKQDDQ